MAVTMTQIANEAGVSVAVISRLLRDDPTLRISPERRQQIVAIIKQKGEMPEPQSPLRKRLRPIVYPINRQGWTAEFKQDLFNSECYRSFQAELARHGFRLDVVLFNPGEESQLFDDLCTSPRRCEGLFIGGGMPAEAIDVVLKKHTFPHVCTEDYAELMGLNSVLANSYGGIAETVKHLAALGHRRIGYLGQRSLSRFPMLIHALSDAQLPVDQSLYCWVVGRRSGETRAAWRTWARKDFEAWYDPKTGPTAIVCQNDYTAYGAIDALNARGLQAGADLSLVGYDNSEVREGLGSGPAILTTIDRPADLMARRAAEVLVNQIVHDQPEIVHERIPAELIIRETTGPCSDAAEVAVAKVLARTVD